MGDWTLLIQSMADISGYLDDRFDLDRGIEGQACDAYGGACVFTGITQNGNEQIGRTVGYEMLFHEIGSGRYENGNFHDPLDAIEVAECGPGLCKNVDGAGSRCDLTFGDRQLVTDPTGMHQLAILQRQLPRCEQKRAGLRKGHVVCGGCCGDGQRYAQIFRRLSIVSVITLILAYKGTSRSNYMENR